MSSVVTVPGGASSRPSRTTLPTIVDRRRPTDLVAGLIGAVAFCLIAFLASGGVDLAPNTWVQVGLLASAGLTVLTLLLVGNRGRAWGGFTLLWFAALAAFTYASIAWSVQPANSWLEANRTLSYLGAFATALVLARLVPGRWRALAGATAAATTVVCGYALLVKVFPATFDPGDAFGRLRAPFDYWNAVGLMGALGLAPSLWAGARREGALLLRALAAPATAILLSALLLASSRGAVLAALIGVATWFVLSPLRLRSTVVLALGAVGGGVIAAWGLSTHGISADGVSIAARNSAGHSFGVLIVAALCVTGAASFAATLALDRFSLSGRARRAVSVGLLAAVALIPVAGLSALAASRRGFTGEISHIWQSLTNPNGKVGDQPGRLVNLSNSRSHYWSQAITLGEHHLLAGVGALGFATAQPSSSGPVWNPQHAHVVHAHGYLAETFADFGLLGLAISLGLLVAWGVATGRTLELGAPRRTRAPRGPPSGDSASTPLVAAGGSAAEPAGLIALLAVAVTFGIHSLIDWTWFIPGTAIPALACAGWLAGRGPLSAPIGRRPRSRRLRRAPGVAMAIAVTAVVAILAVWMIVQPLRSFDSYSAAETAAIDGNAAAALRQAHAAAVENPLAIDPLFLLSVIYNGLGNSTQARHELVLATSRQPSNPQTWQELGCYDYAHHVPAAAAEFHRMLGLQPAAAPAIGDLATFCAGAPA